MHRVLMVFLFCVIGCTGFPSDPDGLRKRADELDAQRDHYEKVEDKWGSGEVVSSFTAYVDGDQVHLIEEQMTRGRSGHSVNRYYFHDDRLFCYREKRMNLDNTIEDIEIFFDGDGQAVASSQQLNGSPTTLESYVVSMAQKHGRTLRELVRGAPLVPEE